MSKAEINLPPKLVPIFTKAQLRYRGAYGGRGSGKSFSFALMTAVRGYAKKLRILCAREIQNSLTDSVFAEIKTAIESIPWLNAHYEIGQNFIRGANGTEYLFKGLRQSQQMNAIKSTANIDICWVEEAETVSEASWKKLIPTIRADNSEIWITWNPEDADSATNKRFIENPPENSKIEKLNYNDNPWFPKVLEQERIADLKRDLDYYAHIWEGETITRSDAKVIKRHRVEEFTPGKDWTGPYHGMDFGFANDPTIAVRCWIFNNRLWIEYDAGKTKLELDDTAYYFKEMIPNIEDYTIRGDSARPESISYLKRHGLPKIISVSKGKIEDGIAFLNKFEEIVIHPRCKGTMNEARLYSYKIDKYTGDILPQIVDAHNHYWDGIRYAIQPIIKQGNGLSWDQFK